MYVCTTLRYDESEPLMELLGVRRNGVIVTPPANTHDETPSVRTATRRKHPTECRSIAMEMIGW